MLTTPSMAPQATYCPLGLYDGEWRVSIHKKKKPKPGTYKRHRQSKFAVGLENLFALPGLSVPDINVATFAGRAEVFSIGTPGHAPSFH
jgi:hypothetical protein